MSLSHSACRSQTSPHIGRCQRSERPARWASCRRTGRHSGRPASFASRPFDGRRAILPHRARKSCRLFAIRACPCRQQTHPCKRRSSEWFTARGIRIRDFAMIAHGGPVSSRCVGDRYGKDERGHERAPSLIIPIPSVPASFLSWRGSAFLQKRRDHFIQKIFVNGDELVPKVSVRIHHIAYGHGFGRTKPIPARLGHHRTRER